MNNNHTFGTEGIKKRDFIKKTICKRNNVSLFVIPYTQDLSKLSYFIRQNIKLHECAPNIFDFNVEVDFSNIHNVASRLQICKSTAQERGGKCLSTDYQNAHQLLEWECAKGHRWKAPWTNVITQASWCRKCGGTEPLTIKEMQEIAKSRGGKCLSKI